MYFVWLFFVAFLLIFFFCTNWPVKLYHYFFLRQLADRLGSVVQNQHPALIGTTPEVNTIYHGKPLKIRFIEGLADALQPSPGLEIRMELDSGVIMEFSGARACGFPGKQREWGEFVRFVTGDPGIDSRWFILTPDTAAAACFWEKSVLKGLLAANPRNIEQISVNRIEIIIRLRRLLTVSRVLEIINRLTKKE